MWPERPRGRLATAVNGTADYYDSILARDPQASGDYRFFVPPGSLHCTACGMLPHVMGVMEVMVDWGEKGYCAGHFARRGQEQKWG